MKKHFFSQWVCLMTAGMLAFSVAACSDDDNNGPAFGADGKRLVRQLIGTIEDDTEEYTFSYNSEGQITRSEYKNIYIEDGEKYKDEEVILYSVKENVLTIKSEEKEDGELLGKWEAVYQLNEDGYAASGTVSFEEYEEGEVTYTQTHPYAYTYDEDRYLIIERDGNMVWNYRHNSMGDYTYDGASHLTYYEDKENKANMDFYSMCFGSMHGTDGFGLGGFGFLGKTSKHLLKTGDELDRDVITYKFDSEGYVTEFTVTRGRNNKTWTYQVKYN